MGEAGKPDKSIKLLRLGVHQHLAGKGSAELRHTDGARFADDRVLIREAESFGRGEDRHGFRVREGDLLGIHPCHVLHHTDHCGVIVAELVKLEEVCLHAVIFKMGGDDIGIRIIRRVLHRAEVRHIHILRDDDKPTGMLARGALDTHETQSKAVFLRFGSLDAPLFQILLDIAVGSFFRKGADGAGTEDMVGTEENFRVFMCLCLIFAGKVKVNIRRFLITRVAQEGFKRDIESVSIHSCAAFRAVLFGHVSAAPIRIIRDELTVFAFRTDVVRRQGVDLRDTGHECHDRGTDASSAAHQIAVLEGVFHQLLGRHVNHIIMVVKNGVQLRINTGLYDFRRVFTIDAVHLFIHQITQLLGRMLDFRWKEVLRQELNLLTLLGNGPGRIDDDFLCDIFPEIGKLGEHLIGGAEENGAGTVCIGKLLGSQKNMAVLLIFRIQKMHIGRSNHRLAEALAQIIDSSVPALQLGFILRLPVFHKKGVIADRLNLKIIVIRGKLLQRLIALAPHNGTVKLAHTAG